METGVTDNRYFVEHKTDVASPISFNYLPSPFDGFGLNAAYNLAFSNFEYPDTSPIAAYVDPANVIGLSRHTASGSIFWEKSGFPLRAFYRHRSVYFKPNSNTNRYVRSSGTLNLTGTKDVFYKGVYDSIAEVSDAGPTYYAGVRLRF